MRLLPVLLLAFFLMGQNCEQEPPAPPGPAPGESPYCYGSPTVSKSISDTVQKVWSAIMRGEESTDRRATVRVTMEGGRCTGVVIGKHTFLTAAHCSFAEPQATASLGGWGVAPYWPYTSNEIHPEYKRYKSSGNQYYQGRAYDVAVLNVEMDRTGTVDGFPEPYVSKIFDPLDPADASRCVGFIAQGFGRWEEPALTLREAPYHIDKVTDTSVISKIGPEDGAICFGDSGGPLYAEMDDGSLELVGITSTTASTDCLVSSTHVRASAVKDFIEEHTSP